MSMDDGIAPYGQPGSKLLPETLIDIWAGTRIPVELRELLKLPSPATFESLRDFRLPAGDNTAARAREIICGMVLARRTDILKVAVVKPPRQPPPFNPNHVPWSFRTRKRLAAAQLDSYDRLVGLSFGELLKLEGFGIRSAMDFAVTFQEALLRADVLRTSGTQLSLASASRTLQQFAQTPWADEVSVQDPRFSDLLSGLDSKPLSGLIDDILQDWNSHEARRTAEVLIRIEGEIRRRVDAIGKLPLEQALREFLQRCTRSSGTRLQALLERLGWTGAPPLTLDAAGTRLGITRERMRQIEAAARKRFPCHPVFMPALKRALVLLSAHSPVSARVAQTLLDDDGIVNVPFTPESLLAAASDLGHERTFGLEKIRDVHVISATGADARMVYRQGSRICKASGTCTIAHIQALLKTEHGERAVLQHPGGKDAIRRLLAESSRFLPLGEDWYCLAPGTDRRNTLINSFRKMLSVSRYITIGELREGLHRRLTHRENTRNARIKLHLPPLEIMKELLRVHPLFDLDSAGRVSCTENLEPRKELGGVELWLVDQLRGAPEGMLDRASLMSAARKSGMGEHGVTMMLTYSPVIERLGKCLWTVRGMTVR